jgi:hypothetical protein
LQLLLSISNSYDIHAEISVQEASNKSISEEVVVAFDAIGKI